MQRSDRVERFRAPKTKIDFMNPMTTPQNPPLMELCNVSVVRSGRTVLHGLNLRIADGEHVAILGPNGSGKSTLIKLLTRELYPCYDGRSSMRILGKETWVQESWGQESWNVSELRAMLGVVTNEIAPFCERAVSGRDAVLSGFFSSVGLGRYHRVEPEMLAKIEELLARLEIAHLAERPMGEMSSGEARRVMIARALVHNPRALLFDEPSNSLDVFAQIELRRTMSRLTQSMLTQSRPAQSRPEGGPHLPAVGICGEAGITLLLVTHHLPDIVPEIERVIFLRQGRIAGDGNKAEMLTTERLSGLFGCPVRISVEDGHYHLVS
jgi:iron complex transport system ATP-binding protein